MRKRTGTQAARPGPARPGAPVPGRQDERRSHGGQPYDDRETSLGTYVARLVDEAPPLTSEQRDTLALILRRPRRGQTLNGCFYVMATASRRLPCCR